MTNPETVPTEGRCSIVDACASSPRLGKRGKKGSRFQVESAAAKDEATTKQGAADVQSGQRKGGASAVLSTPAICGSGEKGAADIQSGQRKRGASTALATPAIVESGTESATVANRVVAKRPKVMKSHLDSLCGVCGLPEPGCSGGLSCPACTASLSAERGLVFMPGQRVWCRGFGPMWPARVDIISFASAMDNAPYLVVFYGEKTHAWVRHEQLSAWGSRRPPSAGSIPSKWQRRFAKAIGEVHSEEASGSNRTAVALVQKHAGEDRPGI